MAGVARRTLYYHKKQDPAFAALWEEAEQIAVDIADREIRRRAIEGVEDVRYDRNGVIMQRRRVYSDKLAELYMKVKHPDYQNAGTNLQVNVGISFEMRGLNDPAGGGARIKSASSDQQAPKTIDIEEESAD